MREGTIYTPFKALISVQTRLEPSLRRVRRVLVHRVTCLGLVFKGRANQIERYAQAYLLHRIYITLTYITHKCNTTFDRCNFLLISGKKKEKRHLGATRSISFSIQVGRSYISFLPTTNSSLESFVREPIYYSAASHAIL